MTIFNYFYNYRLFLSLDYEDKGGLVLTGFNVFMYLYIKGTQGNLKICAL